MNIKREMKELQHKKNVIKYFKLFGLDEHINNVHDTFITFAPKTKENYLLIMESLKTETLPLFMEENGCIGFNPIDKYTVIEQSDSITKLSNKYLIETKTDRYNSDKLIKVIFYIMYNNKPYGVWIDIPIKYFPEYTYNTETIKDTHETEQAREYNKRHVTIYTTRPVFNGILQTVKFWGGNVTHYTTTEPENEYLTKLLFMVVEE